MDLEQLQPKLFAEFKQILQAERLNHAYLFSGTFASFPMALFLAKSRFCERLQNGLPCGNCRSCRLIEAGEFADVRVIEPSGQIIKTDTVKELLRNFSRSGFEGKAQVFIIKECEKLHINAANSLLKFIEEPQSSAYMILLTADESKVLPTIKSRTQVFQFPKNEAYLQKQAEQAGLLKNQARLFAQLAHSPEELDELLGNKKNLELEQACRRFAASLQKNQDLAYLETARLVQYAAEKNEQALIFQLLTILLAEEIKEKQNRRLLQLLLQARLMWQSNVSFQNALEYMVIS
ncbi:DNA polymerase III subunit delta' [Streptococcus sp. H49]|uniref:DNA polymerase III subunit delta' n=1 Tax=Streptococcus huangxiaojuni TaxID=3237239 RepID=UPI0034A48F98